MEGGVKRKGWLAVGGSSGCCCSLECRGWGRTFGQALQYYGSDLLGMGSGDRVGGGYQEWVGNGFALGFRSGLTELDTGGDVWDQGWGGGAYEPTSDTGNIMCFKLSFWTDGMPSVGVMTTG